MTNHLALVISNFGSGGAERVLSIMANYWAEKNHQVTLISFSNPALDFFPLHENVRRVGLNLISPSGGPCRAITENFRRTRCLRRAIKGARPAIVISFEDTTNVLALAATRGLGLPVIISQRVDPRFTPIGRAWSFLRRCSYPRADAVVVQTATVAGLITRFVPRSRIEVIPNPINAASGYGVPPSGGGARADTEILGTPDSLDNANAPLAEAGTPYPNARKHEILSVGRLCRQKGHDLLLQSFARCRPAHPDWRLTIMGEGPERAALERLRAELGLSGSVSLPGEIPETSEAYATADVFVLSSRFEGFPNALCEAMAHGLAVISFDCPSGPAEIIRPETDGILVPPGNVEALAGAMDRLMGDAALRQGMGSRAVEGMRRFSVANVMAQWDRLLDRVRI